MSSREVPPPHVQPKGAPAGSSAKPWYREPTPAQWRVLTAAFLGWVFNGYEAYALFLAMGPALRQLLEPAQQADLSSYAGILIAATLLGWAIGGVVGGIAADYFGRRRTMMATILLYAGFSGLTGLAQSWEQLAVLRLLTGFGLGGEWATGATLIAETWPSRCRPIGQGIMQSAFGWGSLLAAATWYLLQTGGGEEAWRTLFFLGVTPAFFVLYIWRNVNESEKWLAKQAERRRLQSQRRSGAALSNEQAFVADFTVVSLFRDRKLRRLVLLAIVMSGASSVGYWAVATWIPAYTVSVATAASVADPGRWGAIAGLSHTLGAIAGYLAGGFLADVIGRRALLACYFGGGLLTIPLLYVWAESVPAVVVAAGLNGMLTLGQFVWMAIYPPELFPTAVRATAVSLIFNSVRFLSFLGPLFAGVLISRLGGYGAMAMLFSVVYVIALAVVPLLPETKGKPLPA